MSHVDETLAAYESVAARYDELNARLDTAGLVERYVEAVERYGPGGRRLLDAGCGTGRSSVAFRERGFEVTGYDLSPAMVAMARRRPGTEGIRFLVGRLQEPPPGLAGFDVVACVDVPMAYLTGAEQLRRALAAARDQLVEDGVLLFDLSTIGYYRRAFGVPAVADRGDRYVAWFAVSPRIEADAVVVTQFDLFERAGEGWERVSMRHVQRHHSDRTVRRVAERAGLRVVAAYGLVGTSAREPADEDEHDRILYVARRVG
ncbi:class I SAM-dependent DNA methyltransferase [Streptosporangium roseum]|uniref:Methylase involved in ubiquinone/menaquinone biosynthesis-like protein n=1 Tax=Streptosporangium roseum (strain ATCC 12428 / DSM 43021 / JCM 3005 / KCTC 9067 / NCIMB 10171 / NRRL 2505 / NI 9100) TaxID=479432 RepID=D2AZZ5_STRRD|nr:class I SAM-dependent methyltransferase [Streptosporangium roseum]ACZ87229.1 Methylase involved in ubiquinone/menaquinone biosynthesis-like protein [Streptosporangium roseum DSM 43021]